jgi:hypothetical protein
MCGGAFVTLQPAALCGFFCDLARWVPRSAVASLKSCIQQRAYLSLVGAVFVVLVGTYGFASKALGQVAPPTVTSVSPNTGPPSGGTSVTITGANFSRAIAVRFGNTASSFTVNSASQITATAPAGSGTVDVTVTTAGGTSATSSADQFSYGRTGTTVTLSSSKNPSSIGQSVTFSVRVTGLAPTGLVALMDGTTQISTATLATGTTSFTISSLAVGSHSITAKYGGDSNNAASNSAVLIQIVSLAADSGKLRALQVSVTPVIAQISGQATVGAIENAIDVGFSDNPQPLTPNGSGFTLQIGLDQPAPALIGNVRTSGPRTGERGPSSLANGRHGGNGAPPGTRLIDMSVIPLPPGSGMPPVGENRFSLDEVAIQFAAGTTPQQVGEITQRFGLAIVTQQAIGMLQRPVYTARITGGQSVREMIRLVEAAGLQVAVQPSYAYRTTQDRTKPNGDQSNPLQYVASKLHLADVHRITKGDGAVIAVIDSEIDPDQSNLVGSVSNRYNAGCGTTIPDAHGTGMAGAIAAHGQLLGVAPNANIIAICAFDGAGQPQSSTIKIIKGLDYAIQRGARIVNMSFAGPRDPALSQALQIAREKGVLVIAAAGNAGPKSPPLYPGADPNVMAVTATDESDNLFTGANQGRYIAVAAPGVDVLVPAPGGRVQLTTGTSVATANVSGVAALLIAHKPSLKPEEIRAVLVSSAKHLGSGSFNPQFGAGLVDPRKALEMIISNAPIMDEDGVKHFVAAPDAGGNYVADEFVALGYASEGKPQIEARPAAARSRQWLAWMDMQGTNFSRNTFGSDLKGSQVNATAGITRKFTPNFLVGVFGGYEHFDYSSQAINGMLKGNGSTIGAYLGWRPIPSIRFDLGGAWSDILIDSAAGAVSGSFTGQRWLATSGLTGTYRLRYFVFEPSVRVYTLWEHENTYTDSLGTQQTARNFATGRASGGVKMSYPLAWSSMPNLAPYVGLYGDYYFSVDDAGTAGLSAVPLLQGWSGRATAGMALTFGRGGQLNFGGEYAGIGSDVHIWTWRIRGSVPFY